jgi:hypothetical protein
MKLSVFLDEKLVYVHVFDLQERQPDGVLCFFLFPLHSNWVLACLYRQVLGYVANEGLRRRRR